MMNRRYVKNEWGVTIDYEVAENLMDNELREKIAYELQLISDQEFFDIYFFMYLIDIYIIYINRLPVQYCMLISFIPLHRFSKVRVD